MYSSEMESLAVEDFYLKCDFRLQQKHLKGMEMDDSIMECIPDSSKLDNAIGDDSLLLSALKNDIQERSIETASSWKSIVTVIFGTEDELSQIKNTRLQHQEFLQNKPILLLQQDDEEHQNHAVDEASQQVEKAKNRTLQQDHAVFQENSNK